MVQKPTQKPTPAKSKAKAKAKRQTKKHQASHEALRHRVWLAPLIRLWARVPKTVRVPAMDHEVETLHVVAFVVLLGVAIGAGYGGAQVLFGSDKAKVPSVVAQQSPRVIFSEPNGDAPHDARAYEEKVAEEIYLAPEPHEDATDTEVASLPPAIEPPTQEPTQELGQQPSQQPPSQPGQPRVEPSGAQALWLKNALNVPMPHEGPMLAIVIDDMGVDRKRSRHMWQDVPGPLTLSFMGYADDLPSQTQEAHDRGHELMLHMSMEPSDASIDPGPNVLMSSMADGELTSLANWGMDRFEGFVGVNNHMGSRFTEDPRAMRVVLAEVQKRGLLFLDSRTSPKSVGRSVARDLGLTFLERNVFLDNDNDVEKVRHQLEQVERLARKQGFAIAIGHPRDATIEALKTWIPQAKERGINIVPVSMLLKGKG
ncbi:MAG: divergent polysaccharide deacetylase family protein [Rhodospirillales bacterium]|nr:divergent polysaccharide deacetylase family protein [Rhodospirillales bacterium]